MTGPGVFHTTLNWPSALVSPINPDFCKSWFFSSILLTMPDGALNVCPACHSAKAGFWRPAGSRSMRQVAHEQQHHHQGSHDLWGCQNRLLSVKTLASLGVYCPRSYQLHSISAIQVLTATGTPLLSLFHSTPDKTAVQAPEQPAGFHFRFALGLGM